MNKRLEIRIPKELHRRLKQRSLDLSQDGTEHFPMSEICINAITKELHFLDMLSELDRRRILEAKNETI